MAFDVTTALATFKLDPDAKLDFTVDWRNNGWLQVGENIIASVWTVPAGLTQPYAATFNNDIATVWLHAGGVQEQVDYLVSNKVTTNQNRVDERTLVIQVRAR